MGVPRGYNHDIRYRGRVFHVQSEVSVGRRPQICTQLFADGAVLATARRALPVETSANEIEQLMRAQHKALLRELCRGSYDAWLSPGCTVAPQSVELDVRMQLPAQSRAVHRRNATLEVQVRDDADTNEIVTLVSCGGDVIAIRRTSYEPSDSAAEVKSLMDSELDAMIAKVRRGGVDARLPAFVFVPPPLPR
ncbi:MAG TPA: hypothetical protein VFG69_06990 [Nannocystaceae bacterium]|nr:hypothetical protein [Nannocystaceae bacterium]